MSKKSVNRRGPARRRPRRGEALATALAYVAAGLSVIPVFAEGGDKKRPVGGLLPGGSWNPYRERPPTAEEVEGWFGADAAGAYGVGVVAGAVSGDLEVVDVDGTGLVAPFREALGRRAPGLFERLPRVLTPGGGMHLYFRCAAVGRNRKLAGAEGGRPAGAERYAIETRAEGGYAVAPRSAAGEELPGDYRLDAGPDLTRIPVISPAGREAVLAAARSLDRRRPATPQTRPARRRRGAAGLLPGDDFDRRADWGRDVLGPAGWEFVREDRDGTEYWRRPGKDGGHSATVNHGGSGRLYVFSTDAGPFEAERPYTKFAAYALLEHGGDFAAAARRLAREGFGAPRPRNGRGKPRSPYAGRVLAPRRAASPYAGRVRPPGRPR